MMIEQDSVRLLRECDAGVRMGAQSIEEVEPYAAAPELRRLLSVCREEHMALGSEIRARLDRFRDKGKEPSPLTQGMSWVKTKTALTVSESDGTIADLMTDGCNMGVKSLNRYLNEYGAAEEYAKDIAKRLIKLEQGLATDLQAYL